MTEIVQVRVERLELGDSEEELTSLRVVLLNGAERPDHQYFRVPLAVAQQLVVGRKYSLQLVELNNLGADVKQREIAEQRAQFARNGGVGRYVAGSTEGDVTMIRWIPPASCCRNCGCPDSCNGDCQLR